MICLYIALLLAGAATAQRNAETQSQFRTDISISAQLKGSAMPGLQYRTSGTKSVAKPAGDRTQQSLGLQIKTNAEPGKVYKKTNAKGTSAAPAASGHNLPSDTKAEPVKQEPAPEMPKNITQ